MTIHLKPAHQNNWDYILKLRNSSYKYFSKQNKPIPKDEHYEYMTKQLSNPNFHHWIIVDEQENVGYVRLLDNDVGIMVEKEYQNKGIASQALFLLEKEAKKSRINRLIARVAIENESSKKIFEKCNYKLKQFYYEKDL